MKCQNRLYLSAILLLVAALPVAAASSHQPLRGTLSVPSLDDAMASRTDLWGELAMRQTNGPSYEFFAPLLSPLRYVNADFRYYPIVLSAPNAQVKARLIANGSGLNHRGGTRSWTDNGIPARFRVGPDEFLFGGLPDRVHQPTLAEGWLPIVEIRYRHPSPMQPGGNVPLAEPTPKVPPEIYRLEAFAATAPHLAAKGLVFVKFDLIQGTNGYIAVDLDAGSALKLQEGRLFDNQDRLLALFDAAWKWERQRAVARLRPGAAVVLAIPTQPLDASLRLVINPATYAEHRQACAETWRKLLARGMNVQTPEPYVNNAWRHLLCQNFGLINGNSIRCSAGNQYDKLYVSEGSDAALACLVWGYESDMRRLMVPLFDFTRKDLECHQAGFKLNNLCRYYWQTRDHAAVSDLRPRWEPEAARLANTRTNEYGLCPKGQYCGDISTLVHSLTVDAKGWRALHDLSAVLAQTGAAAEAERYRENAARFKRDTLIAIDQSLNRQTTPPFVPVALYADEPAHDPITANRIGSYWNIVIGYVIGSGIFPPGSEEETWIPRYQEQHGGLCMGMLRAGGGYTFWTSSARTNPLYGTRYALDTLRRDDPDRALVSFYGMLAQGFTPNTFVSGEGCSLSAADPDGRFFYCPPNSAANAHFLSLLRNLLVQDWDLDVDGEPETLRLLFATSKRWLEDGKTLTVERAPTAFGPVSVRVQSHLARGELIADLDLPARNTPKQTFLRLRVPDGWRVTSGRAHLPSAPSESPLRERTLLLDERGTADISALSGKVTLRFQAQSVSSH
ncbi:MAG TPA: hypothetical protein P5205_10920 [Candidatus Paceibacterota bacterium]|nr:hypothetical protein [Verrucomicrobiota bacterium]HSA10868.1 hypothetical protein [Candidatus Paceibacterota bacterium]